MFKVTCVSFGAMLLAGMAVPALAQAPAAAPAQPRAASSAPSADPNEIVCEKVESTGSRIGRKKVCMTRAEWADRRLQDRQELERVQIQRGTKGE